MRKLYTYLRLLSNSGVSNERTGHATLSTQTRALLGAVIVTREVCRAGVETSSSSSFFGGLTPSPFFLAGTSMMMGCDMTTAPEQTLQP